MGTTPELNLGEIRTSFGPEKTAGTTPGRSAPTAVNPTSTGVTDDPSMAVGAAGEKLLDSTCEQLAELCEDVTDDWTIIRVFWICYSLEVIIHQFWKTANIGVKWGSDSFMGII